MIFRVLPLLLVLTLCTCGRGPEKLPDTNSVNPPGPLSIRYRNHLVTVEPDYGGRLASYTLDGRELLQTTRDENGWQWGSTVWTSPQSAWKWPPESTFDTGNYAVTSYTKKSIALLSAIDPATGLQLEKIFDFTGEPKGMVLRASYRLTNHGADTISRGIWENTRLPYGGEYSFGVDSLRRDGIARPFARRGKSTLVQLNAEDEEKGKLFVHPSRGRVTYVNDGLRLRKLWFADEGPVAPGQAPLELYLAPEEGFTELEIQGIYRRLAPGESTTLSVAWQASRLEE